MSGCNESFDEFKRKYLTIRNQTLLEFLSEVFGTFIIVAVGELAVAMGVLGGSPDSDPPILQMAFCSGFAVMTGIYVSDGLSGGHLNPIISFAFFCVGKMKLTKFLLYTLAQFIGGFLGAAITYLMYHQLILLSADNKLLSQPQENATSQIFSTFPDKDITWPIWIVDQVFGTAMFVFAVFAYVDPNGCNIPRYIRPFVIGMTITMLITCTAMLTGAALNPARDFTPRILSYCVGYGTSVFMFQGRPWFLVPLLVPYVGSFLGAWLYEIFFCLPLEARARSEANNIKCYATQKSSDDGEATSYTTTSSNCQCPSCGCSYICPTFTGGITNSVRCKNSKLPKLMTETSIIENPRIYKAQNSEVSLL